jgi:predicted metal-dependent hydrolase
MTQTNPIKIDLLVRSRRKTIALVVNPDASLTVRAPLHMLEGGILKFVKSHEDWIRKNQAKARLHAPPVPKRYQDGESFPYLGKMYPLQVVTVKSPALTWHPTGFILARRHLSKAEELFLRWYKKQARALITERVASLAQQHGFSYQKMHISSARTRWGSCSSLGTISFTWRLVMAPLEIVDYVVIHELVHTKIRNHSKDFYTRVGKILPDYKKRIGWLKRNGKFLHL